MKGVCLLLFPLLVLGQPGPTFERLWLYNSEGKIAGDKDVRVSVEYFNTKWVAIQSDILFGSNTQYWAIIQRNPDDEWKVAFNPPKLSQEVLSGIKKAKKGEKLIFIVQEINLDGSYKRSGYLEFVLE